MRLTLIAAAAENNALGKDNHMIWHLPDDFKRFKQLTSRHHIIMGRKTFESLGKPLAGRTNIVITSNPGWNAEGVKITHSIDAALKEAFATEAKSVYIIGGGEIFKQSLSRTDRVYLTRVHATLEGDAFFPVLPENEWKLHSRLDFEPDEKHQYAYSFEIWDRVAGGPDRISV